MNHEDIELNRINKNKMKSDSNHYDTPCAIPFVRLIGWC